MESSSITLFKVFCIVLKKYYNIYYFLLIIIITGSILHGELIEQFLIPASAQRLV